MARRVYDTGQASPEEVADVLRLLAEYDIPHYRTPSGVFGLTPGALWVRDDADYAKARRLIEGYDRARATTGRGLSACAPSTRSVTHGWGTGRCGQRCAMRGGC